ncbi:HD-GYP domain-containing protein [Telmatospirillum siberiense]|uniref:HD-GYP domain-containing protein n=1 Tax=Telmatospirillum siberiense TaxID=382514 RepID=UPI00130413C8|nr:HD domain-containing phosphohydrolase [Telmatospirillum siberiense]
MRFNLNSFLLALSTMLDFVESDLLGVASNHGRRVAYITARLIERAGLSDAEIFDAVALALLHDNGLTEALLTSSALPVNVERMRHAENLTAHCEIGEHNLAAFPFLTEVRGAIKHHHEQYDGQGFFGLAGEDIPLAARIIGFADYVDLLFDFSTPDQANREKIADAVAGMRSQAFSPRNCDLFDEIAAKPAFWLDLQDDFIDQALKERVPDIWQELSWDRILEISRVFSRIVDCKSQFTQRHSSGLEEKAARMAEFYQFDHETNIKVRIAASLHDIGKLAIPNSILDKPDRLTPFEFRKMQEHTYYTRRCLERIEGFADITEWAANHHERLDGSGYPLGLTAGRLDFNSRLMACLDIYQALTEERPYRRSLPHREAMAILRPQAEDGLLEKGIVADLDQVFAPPA